MAEHSVRFGIMGCANIARKVGRAIILAPNSTLHAIASRSVERAKQFATANQFPETVKIYGSYEDILDDPLVDVVYIPLPTSLHAHWAVLAAQNKKHVLLEKPTALDLAELDKILDACRSNGVQFMDGTMWLHHPRTAKMKELISDIGQVNYLYSTTTIYETPEFFENNIRINPEMDGLGALGDLGWYSIGNILWAKNYQLPTAVTALPGVIKNSAGVILSCTASLQYDDDQDQKSSAVFHCSFLSRLSSHIGIMGTNGTLQLTDFLIPFQEDSASFDITMFAKFQDMYLGWTAEPEKIVVTTELPQEALMVQDLATLVEDIKKSGHGPDTKWPEISRKTQLVLDAVKKSVHLGCKLVHL